MHGMGQQFKDQGIQARNWLPAAHSGLRRTAHPDEEAADDTPQAR